MTNFRSVKGDYFLSKVYRNDKVAKECVIESVLTNCFMICSNCNMITVKNDTTIGVTDGVIEFFNPNGDFLGHGLMEVKRAINFNSQPYKHQLLQLIAYYYRSIYIQEYKILLLTSDRYFSYIWIPENIDSIMYLCGKVAEAKIKNPSISASELWSYVSEDWSLDMLTIHSWTINNEFDFLDPITEIYNLLNGTR